MFHGESEELRKYLLGDVYGSVDETTALPQKHFPYHMLGPDHAYQIVHDELMLDGNARMNLATFCSTWEEPQVHRLMDESINKNMVDKDEYPQTAEIEAHCVRMIAELWNSPDPVHALGTSTVGSSEAAELGGLAAKWRWRKQREADGKDTSNPNFVCGPVQICWHKFATYFDVERREVPMSSPDNYMMTPESAVALCDENTIAVVVTLGQTFTGLYEDVYGISKALDELQERTGLDIPIHVDAASGGFLAPFCAPGLEWDFRLPRVRSINSSGHKFGLAPLGVGWAVWRDKTDMPDELIFWVNYLGGNMPSLTLNFSRSAASVVAQFYNILRLGREGYREIHSAGYETSQHIARGLEKIGPFEMIHRGQMHEGIPAIAWRIKDGADVPYNLFDLADRLRTYGWLVPAYTLPADLTDVTVQRILIRGGLRLDLANMLLHDVKRSLEVLDKHQPSTSMTEKEAGGFHHGAKQDLS